MEKNNYIGKIKCKWCGKVQKVKVLQILDRGGYNDVELYTLEKHYDSKNKGLKDSICELENTKIIVTEDFFIENFIND